MATAAASVGGSAVTPRIRRVTAALVTEWRELGGLGRVAVAGLFLSGVVAVILGWWIEAAIRHHLLDGRTEVMQEIVDDLAVADLLPLGAGASVPESVIAEAVEHRLIGGETVGVTVRDLRGAVVYDDDGGAAAPEDAPGVATVHVEQHADGLLHFQLPVELSDGRVIGALEVTQEAGSFNEVLVRIRRNLWLAITTGLASLGLAMGALTWSHARVLDRRRRHAEQLLRELLRAEDEERHRIVGSLHDDVGQPLYRLLYGLEGCRVRVAGDPAVSAEMERLGGLVREVDGTLRAELRQLNRSCLDPLDLASALDAVAEDCRAECGLAVGVQVELLREPQSVARSVLVRAVQEALLNVRKHAVARHVRIRAHGDDRRVAIEVIDDGRGPTGTRGLGLTTATERLDAIGGGLTISRGPVGGTVLRVWVPLQAEVAR